MRTFIAHFLFVLAAWTLLIKFVIPIVWAIHEGVGVLSLVLWDFWWVAHIWLGWALLVRPRHLMAAAVAISAIEIVIVVVKFALFLPEPQWTLWTMNWFVNKVFVLGCFILLLGDILLRPGRYRTA